MNIRKLFAKIKRKQKIKNSAFFNESIENNLVDHFPIRDEGKNYWKNFETIFSSPLSKISAISTSILRNKSDSLTQNETATIYLDPKDDVDLIITNIINQIPNTVFEYGEVSEVEQYFRDSCASNYLILSTVVSGIHYHATIENSKEISNALLRFLARMDYQDIPAAAKLFMIDILKNEDIEMARNVLRCMQNWNNIETLKWLDSSPRLNSNFEDYKNRVKKAIVLLNDGSSI
jgi:hypothetical protein